MKNLPLLLIALLLAMGCSNPYERDNPTDPIHIYKITFTASDATGGTAPAAVSGSYGDNITLPDGSGLVKNGYVFNGWTDQAGNSYSVGDYYAVKGNAALNVKWLPVYTVTYDGNGATSGTPPLPNEAAAGSAITLSGNWMSKTGHIFGGWAFNASGTGTRYEAYSSYYVEGNITLYAVWLPAYTVTFDANGATSGTAPATITVAATVGYITLPGQGDLKRIGTGYIFVGWATDVSGTGTSYKIGSSYDVSKNITLYAMWVLCSDSNSEICYYDKRDSQSYRITTIGTQTWMAENLNYNAPGSKCYNDLNSNCDIYGRLYNWDEALTVCPEGWHLPSDAEWDVMTANIGGSSTAAKKLKATSGWYNNGNGTDNYGFSALPGGSGGSDGNFGFIETQGIWWSSSEHEYYSGYAYYRNMYRSNDTLFGGSFPTHALYSIRCLKNGSSAPPSSSSIVPSSSSSALQNSYTDTRDGQEYKITTIGTQTWFAKNLNYNASGSKCYNDLNSNCSTYGRLYNWAAAKNACPDGWHLPNNAEWNAMTASAGGENIGGGYLKAKSGWNNGGNGTDNYGFAALPGGYGGSDGSFDNIGDEGYWWSSSEYEADNNYAYNLGLYYNSQETFWYSDNKPFLLSVRCVRD